jgi:hypothetical protein
MDGHWCSQLAFGAHIVLWNVLMLPYFYVYAGLGGSARGAEGQGAKIDVLGDGGRLGFGDGAGTMG